MRISIITINYNNLDGLRLTMDSVLTQQDCYFEYIVIDGGSTDGSRELIESVTDKLTYWVSEPDKGIFNAMNKGIKVAQGEYCIFMNSGDRLADSTVLKRAAEQLTDKDFYTGHLATLGNESDVIFAPTHITAYSLVRFPLSHQATFIRTEVLKQRSYRDEYRLICDWEQMVYELLLNNRTYAVLDFVVAHYDRSGVSSQPQHAARYEAERKEAIEQLFPPRIWEAMMGGTPLERKCLHAFTQPPLKRDFKLLRNVFKALIHDLFHKN